MKTNSEQFCYIPENIGARLTHNKCRFTVWSTYTTFMVIWTRSPESYLPAKCYELTPKRLESEGWTPHSLSFAAGNYWTTSLENIKEGTLYFLELKNRDGTTVINPDPGSWSQPYGVHGPSEVISSEFQWSDQSWKGKEWDDLVFYQAHPSLFSTDETLQGIVKWLKYLKKIGFSVLYLLPIMQFPGGRNLGYDGAYPRAVHNTYGGLRSAQALVNACHECGISVAFDMHEQNHMGPEGAYLWNFAPYFSEIDTPWGLAKNNDQKDSEGQRRSLIETIRFYFEILHADIVRMDACHAVIDNSPDHILAELQRVVEKLSRKLGRPLYLVAETDLDDPQILLPQQEGGFGWQGHLLDKMHHGFQVIANKQIELMTANGKGGYFKDYIAPDPKFPLSVIADFLEVGYKKHFSEYAGKSIGKDLPSTVSTTRIVSPISNHDQTSNVFGLRIAHVMEYEFLKAYMAFGLTLPSPPFVFFGDESASKEYFYYFTDHSDPDVIKGVREGRLREFGYFYQSQDDFPDPQGIQTYLASKPELERTSPRQRSFRDMVTFLLKYRNESMTIKQGNRKFQTVTQYPGRQLLSFLRTDKESVLVSFLNLSDSVETVPTTTITGKNWKVVFDTQDSRWDGPGKISTIGETFTIGAHSFVLIEGKKESLLDRGKRRLRGLSENWYL